MKIDPADVLLFSGLAALTLGTALVSPILGLLAFGSAAMYLGLAAGRSPVEK